jgi:hypothetical protein
MANTYEIIDKVTLTSTQASITFSSIPGTYTDLLVKLSARTDWSNGINADGILIRPNSSSTNMTARRLTGSGSTADSDTNIGPITTANASSTSNTFGNSEIYIPNYAGSTNKSMSIDGVSESNTTTTYLGLFANLWSNTSVISSLQILGQNGSFVSGSSFYLYGIKNS